MLKNVSQKTKPAVVVVIDSVEKLKALCDKEIVCKFTLDGSSVELPVRRLNAAEEEPIRSITRAVQPPFKKELNNYDQLDSKYQAAIDRAEKTARAMTVYMGCPTIAAMKAGLTRQEDVYAFVQALFPENILEIIYLTIRAGGISLEERVNFTSPQGSES